VERNKNRISSDKRNRFQYYEYSSGDCHMTNSIEPVDDVMTVATVLWVALRTGAAH
jgi:hypothetical protein